MLRYALRRPARLRPESREHADELVQVGWCVSNGALAYEVAHAQALAKYGVSPFSVYHPEVIQAFPEAFSPGFNAFWGLP